LFGPAGLYEGLNAVGQKAHHLVSFVRGGGAITLVPRLVLGLAGTWGDTAVDLPAGGWRNEFTGDHIDGGRVRVAQILARFPVALLSRA
jgi:(1->4)-alpha-D-glucan 1-alpha-D-glucosylmutase